MRIKIFQIHEAMFLQIFFFYLFGTSNMKENMYFGETCTFLHYFCANIFFFLSIENFFLINKVKSQLKKEFSNNNNQAYIINDN